jgi:hypothetical protein
MYTTGFFGVIAQSVPHSGNGIAEYGKKHCRENYSQGANH